MAPISLAFLLLTGGTQAQTPAPTVPPAPPAAAPAPTQISDTLAYVSDTQKGKSTGVPLVTVRLNDAVEATFMLDTGTSACAVTDALVAKLALSPQPTSVAAAPLIMDSGKAQVVPLTIQVGRFRFPRFPTLVIKAGRFQDVLGHPLDGILGANILSHFAVLLQPQSHLVTLITPGSLSTEQRRAWGLTHATSLPLTRASTNTYWVPVTLANGALVAHENLMLDTGSVTSVISHQTVTTLGLTPEPATLDVPFGTATLAGGLVRVPAVTLGAVEGASPPVNLTMQNGIFLFPREADVFGASPHTLGMNILGQCDVLMDFPGTQLLLQPLVMTMSPAAAGISPPSR